MIIKSRIQTPDGTILESKHRHDFVSYTDKNGQYYALDGGNEYQKTLFDKADFVDISIHDTSPFEEIREHFTWGSYGKDGKDPLKISKLKDLEEDHIQAILENVKLKKEVKEIFLKELEHRVFVK